MAIFHFHVQMISRSAGRSATDAAASRAGEVIIDTRTGEVHDYSRKRGRAVLHADILAPAGAPDWAFNRTELWNKVEHAEKRKDAQVCREIDLSLPHELSSRQRLDLIHSYVKANFITHGMVADVCLKAPGKDGRNFHAYVMLTMRRLEGNGFGKKAREWNPVWVLESWRANWAKAANAALEQAGHEARIDHRSNEARGLDEVPGQHRGSAATAILFRGEHSEVAERQEAERATRERALLDEQLAIARALAAIAEEELAEVEEEEELELKAQARQPGRENLPGNPMRG